MSWTPGSRSALARNSSSRNSASGGSQSRDARDRHVARVVVERGQESRERHHGVGCRTAEHARVERVVEGAHRDDRGDVPRGAWW